MITEEIFEGSEGHIMGIIPPPLLREIKKFLHVFAALYNLLQLFTSLLNHNITTVIAELML